MRYAIVIERGDRNFSGYVPDLPGCIATGDSVEEIRHEIREAMEFHLEGLRADGLPIPEPSSRVEYVEVAAQLHPRPFRTAIAAVGTHRKLR